jgi:P-type conjugative transfer protein TrbJ
MIHLLGKKLYRIFVLAVSMIVWCSSNAALPMIDYASLIQLGNQLMQLKQQTQYIQQQLQTLNGDQYQWSNVQGLINNLGSIVNQTNGIAYSASNINQKFQQAYPGYQAPEDFNQQYKNNANLIQNTLNGVLQSMGSSAQDFQSEQTRLAFLQRQAQGARGQTQAIQASSQIASEMVSQIQLLRQTVIAQSNAQTAYYATQVQNEASGRAELENVINAGSTNIPRYGTSGHPLNLPDF